MKQIEIIRLDHVSFYYKPHVNIINNLTYTIYAKEFYFIVGKSGAGKTTLLNLINGELKPSSGNLNIFGKDINNCSYDDLIIIRRNIGMVFQDGRLIEHLSALDNVALMLYITGQQPLKRARELAGEILDWADLRYHHNQYPDQLSVGQKQRVSIARAIITKPLLLLADEPTGNLDDYNAFKIMKLFIELYEKGTSILCVTHNQTILNTFLFPRIKINDGSIWLNNKTVVAI